MLPLIVWVYGLCRCDVKGPSSCKLVDVERHSSYRTHEGQSICLVAEVIRCKHVAKNINSNKNSFSGEHPCTQPLY